MPEVPECPASEQSRTEMKKNADVCGTGTEVRRPSLVPECSGTVLDDKCRNANAGGINIDADAQEWYFVMYHLSNGLYQAFIDKQRCCPMSSLQLAFLNIF
jgi:hypothetical protein